MSAVASLLSLRVGRQRYLAHPEQIEQIAPSADLAAAHHAGRPLLRRDLATLLDPGAAATAPPPHALLVLLRRRSVALLLERVEDLAAHTSADIRPLAPLLARHLARPWFLGVALADDTPVLVLDLRRIATDVALGVV